MCYLYLYFAAQCTPYVLITFDNQEIMSFQQPVFKVAIERVFSFHDTSIACHSGRRTSILVIVFFSCLAQ